MNNQENKPTSLEDRLISALISAMATACTIAIVLFVFFLITHPGQRLVRVQLFFHYVFSEAFLLTIAFAAILGFFLGFQKMVSIFSFFWGTHPVWKEDWMKKVALAIVVTIATGAVAHLILSL